MFKHISGNFLVKNNVVRFISAQTGDRLPIMRNAVSVESKRKAILLVGAAGMLRLLTLPVSPAERGK